MGKLKKYAIIGGIVFVANKILRNVTSIQKEIIKKLQSKINWLKTETTPIRFKLERNNKNIDIWVKFYDLNHNEIARKYFTLTGNTVSFDFFIVKLGEKKYFAFPYRLFSDLIAPMNGIDLMPFYDDNGMPAIMRPYNNYSLDYIDAIKKLFSLLKKDNVNNIPFVYGNMVQPPAPVQNGTYKIIVHTTGGIAIVKE